MLTSYQDHEAAAASARAGAAGYAMKQIRSQALVDAVHRVAAGTSPVERVGGPTTVGRMSLPRIYDWRLASLSRQEHRVLDGVIDGLTNRQVGTQLSISEQTVKHHVARLFAKLGARNRAEVAVVGDRLRSDAVPVPSPDTPQRFGRGQGPGRPSPPPA